ncbi:MAG: O-antigen ligase family protein [Thermoleophilia bacterium]|nr:O-antigen ligase family protein [Thermoleophilia bacterium]
MRSLPADNPRSSLATRVPPGARRAMLVRVAGAALACLLALLAVVDPVLGLAAVVTIFVAVGFTRSPTFGVCAFAAVTFFEFITEATGNTALSPIKICGGALIVLALLDLVTSARTRRGVERSTPAWWHHPVIVAAMTGFVAVGIASGSWAANEAQVRTLSQRLVTEVLIFLAIGVFLLHRRQFHALATTVLVAGVLSTLYGMLSGAEEFGRSIGTFTDPNEYASAMVASIGLGFGAMGAARTRLGTAACAAGMALCSYGVLTSQSRGGLLALVVVAGVVVLSSRGRERVRMMGASFVLLATLSLVLVATPTGQASLSRITTGDSSGRADLWRIAGLMFKAEPVHGVGLGNFPAESTRYVDGKTQHTELFQNGAPRTTHNSYLEIAAELGVLGLITFGTFAGGAVLLAMRGLRRARRLGDEVTIHLGRGVVAATLGMLATCIFLSNHYGELLWTLLATCVAYGAFVERQLRLQITLEAAHDVVEALPIEDALEADLELDGLLATAALGEYVGTIEGTAPH